MNHWSDFDELYIKIDRFDVGYPKKINKITFEIDFQQEKFCKVLLKAESTEKTLKHDKKFWFLKNPRKAAKMLYFKFWPIFVFVKMFHSISRLQLLYFQTIPLIISSYFHSMVHHDHFYSWWVFITFLSNRTIETTLMEITTHA